MPSGAKKRKALKKKKQQQQQGAIGTSTNNKGFNGDNLHGNDEHGSQDDRESDSNLSSPGSQGNGEFGASAAISSGLAAREISDATAIERGTDDKKIIVEKSPISSSKNSTQAAKTVAHEDPCGDSIKEVAPPVVDSVKIVISEQCEHAETSTHSNLVKQKSDEKKKYPSTGLERDNGKVAEKYPGSSAGTSRKVESVRETEAPVSAEEKRLLLPGPPTVRTSWLSCCGLFDAMTGSDR